MKRLTLIAAFALVALPAPAADARFYVASGKDERAKIQVRDGYVIGVRVRTTLHCVTEEGPELSPLDSGGVSDPLPLDRNGVFRDEFNTGREQLRVRSSLVGRVRNDRRTVVLHFKWTDGGPNNYCFTGAARDDPWIRFVARHQPLRVGARRLADRG